MFKLIGKKLFPILRLKVSLSGPTELMLRILCKEICADRYTRVMSGEN